MACRRNIPEGNETLMFIWKPAINCRISQHIFAASISINLPTGIINPVSSSSGMNSIGEITSVPSSVIMVNLISASAPVIVSVVQSIMG